MKIWYGGCEDWMCCFLIGKLGARGREIATVMYRLEDQFAVRNVKNYWRARNSDDNMLRQWFYLKFDSACLCVTNVALHQTSDDISHYQKWTK
jgi:hypothetical protein